MASTLCAGPYIKFQMKVDGDLYGAKLVLQDIFISVVSGVLKY